MRILHTVASLSEQFGGPTNALFTMATALARRGHDVEVVTTDLGGTDRLGAQPVGEPVIKDGVRFMTFASTLPRGYAASWPLARYLAREIGRFDIAHIHSVHLFHTAATALLAQRAGVPYLIRPHGALNRHHWTHHAGRKWLYWRVLERRLVARSAGLHFVSRAEADEAAPILPRGTRACVVPLGVDTDGLRALASEASRPDRADAVRLLFMGRLAEKKNPRLAVQAIASLHELGIHATLTIAGPPGDYTGADVAAWVHETGTLGKVHYLGPQGLRERAELLASHHVLVLPSVDENFGLVVAEAAAMGTPVVISPGVALAGEIESAGAGMVADLSPGSLATAIAVVVGPAWTAFSRAATGLADERFALDPLGAALEDLYTRCIQS